MALKEDKYLPYVFSGFVFFYIIVVGLLIQFFVLPYLIPSAHYGDGILVGTDTVYFHEEAKKLAQKINTKGWCEWKLKPEGQIMIGITALVYALTGIYKPCIMLFYNALLHFLSVLFLIKLLSNYNIDKKFAILGSFPLAFSPSSLIWTSQIHRDGLYILGFLSIFLAISYISKRGLKPLFYSIILQTFGLFLIYLARTHMILPLKYIFSILFLLAFLLLILKIVKLLDENSIVDKFTLKKFTILSLSIAITANFLLLQHELQTQTQIQIQIQTQIQTLKWERELFVPEKLDKILYRIAEWRYKFLNEYFKDAKGNIEKNFIPQKASDFLFYLPRGLFVGLFYPTPNFWFKEGGTICGTIARAVIPMETIVLWIGVISLFFALRNFQNKISIFIILLVCLMFIYLHVVTEPNLGPIVRKRYVFINTITAFSYSYYAKRISLWLKKR